MSDPTKRTEGMNPAFEEPYGTVVTKAAQLGHDPVLQMQMAAYAGKKVGAMNHLQQKLSEVYAGGEFAGATSWIPGAAGDSLYDFLMHELDDDCIAEAQFHNKPDLVVAMARIVSARHQLEDVLVRLAK